MEFKKCNIIKKKDNGEYYGCLDCEHSYFEDLDGCIECWLPGHWFYNPEYDPEQEDNEEYVYRICEDFKEME